MEDALIAVVLDEGDDGEVIELDLRQRAGKLSQLGEVAQVAFQVALELGEVERDFDLGRASGEFLAGRASRECPDDVVVQAELVTADIAD